MPSPHAHHSSDHTSPACIPTAQPSPWPPYLLCSRNDPENVWKILRGSSTASTLMSTLTEAAVSPALKASLPDSSLFSDHLLRTPSPLRCPQPPLLVSLQSHSLPLSLPQHKAQPQWPSSLCPGSLPDDHICPPKLTSHLMATPRVTKKILESLKQGICTSPTLIL